ncbi:MAG: 50S ribosomal protein L27 [Candidatus Portnoybacteria bacterium RBG_19FT_COMBO_36_7]|uniref:Large ribosomal subunit protein bL27 n=1 Tax=Candidatus Portnoybacteria bacterium RBG_19FT_COMBO_36_7 TaxID=1801992 RepID=A0A1G2F8X2_9BACT|nr:MAG: 50S ribosomal protein L27 [Candidatus Portnoybacteria bacterium RBG_19FT_COMBO_36_7]
MAHTKAAGTSRLGRDSQPKYLGVKLFAGQLAKPGSIIIRQRGTKFKPGKNVKRGNDDTLYSLASGTVQFNTKNIKRFDGNKRLAKVVNVISEK